MVFMYYSVHIRECGYTDKIIASFTCQYPKKISLGSVEIYVVGNGILIGLG